MPAGRSPFEAIRRMDEQGEFWLARELQPHLAYKEWRFFEDAIDRARTAAENSIGAAQDHFGDAPKMIQLGKGGVRYVQDYRLTRYAAYLVAMNSDPRKEEVAAAQTYFAVRTREAEVAAELAASAPASSAAMPTHAEALRGWADALEGEKAAVQAQQVAETRVRALEPAGAFVQDFVSADDCVTLTVLAKQVGIAEGDLRQLLLSKRWIHKKDLGRRFSGKKQALVDVHEWRPSAGHLHQFTLRGQHNAPRHHNGQVRQTLYVTAAGQLAIRALIAGTEALELFPGRES